MYSTFYWIASNYSPLKHSFHIIYIKHIFVKYLVDKKTPACHTDKYNLNGHSILDTFWSKCASRFAYILDVYCEYVYMNSFIYHTTFVGTNVYIKP